MTDSNDEAVLSFLDDVERADDEQFRILQQLRELVFERYPAADERVKYGGLLYSLEDDFGGLFVYDVHVSFEFSDGRHSTTPTDSWRARGVPTPPEVPGRLRRSIEGRRILPRASGVTDRRRLPFVRRGSAAGDPSRARSPAGWTAVSVSIETTGSGGDRFARTFAEP